jgi:hypothetical protein
MAKFLQLPLHAGSTLTLPADAVLALGSPQEIYMVVDAEKQLITLSVRHPEVVHNEAILEQLAELNDGTSLEEYGAPVPESFLNRRGKGPKEGDR